MYFRRIIESHLKGIYLIDVYWCISVNLIVKYVHSSAS